MLQAQGGTITGGNGLRVRLQGFCRVVRKVAPPCVAYGGGGRGASRPWGTDSVGAGAGGGVRTATVQPLPFGGAGRPWRRVCWGCAGCGGRCRLRVSGAQ